MAVEPGQTLSHYRLLEKVGEGGMGVVYRARDEHLDRDVAVKVLPPGRVVDEAARRRFRTEALALSRLNHPNIETAHDFDTEGGVDFLVTEFVPGQTLAGALADGPLAEREVIRLGAQLAEGMTAAHQRGILHRDLKPNNIRLTPGGRLKILDFGLAKLMEPDQAAADAETATSTDAIVGTVPYMAPERLRGEEIDTRTDVYSAGVVLYEMATGRPPHQESVATLLVDSILHQTPVAPRAVNARISPDLERIIVKCLDKDPGSRYQSARELGVDLNRLAASTVVRPAPAPQRRSRRWVTLVAALGVLSLLALLAAPRLLELGDGLLGGPAPTRIESLAVLPLKNLMDDPEQQYFVDGMHEALIADLTRIDALRVISRTSAMRYRDSDKSLPQIARELGVDAIVEGSVLRAEDRVRITAQLVLAATDAHLWAQSYEGDLRDVLRLQSETARAIAREIRVVVTAEDEARLERDRPVDREAYEAYLKGRYYLNQRTEDEIFRAIEYLRDSIRRDPEDPLAHAALAEASLLTGWYRWAAPDQAFPPAKAAAATALALDDGSAEAHTVAAAVHMLWDWDLTRAEGEFRRAIELEPGYPRAHHWYALFLIYVGRQEEAIAQIRRAQELDPLSLIIRTIAGLAYCGADRFEEALAEAQRTLEMNPEFPLALAVLSCAQQGLGRHEEAIAAARRAVELTGGAWEVADLAGVYAQAGQPDRARELLAGLEDRAGREYVPAMSVAAIHMDLAQYDRALDWLERAYEEHAWSLVFLRDSSYDPLRSDPRYQELLRKVGPS